jgi:catechol 2,3-dioxygenase-like lactoylglutathione lyase family enzyme
MIDHVGIPVRDIEKSKAFYVKALAPLGYTLLADYGHAVGFGKDRKPDFWLGVGEPGASIHVCIAAATRSVVRAFHEAALAAGGTDNGAPGVRALYHPSYFGAFVHDPDGHNIEACCHDAYLG